MKAPDIMTVEVRVIRADETIATALELLVAVEARHLPVVDEDDRLVGMLSDRDLRDLLCRYSENAIEFAEAWRHAQMPVADVMTRDPISVTDGADIEDVVELLLDNKVGAIPVVDDAKQVLGIISYIDVLRAWQREHESTEVPPLLPTTFEIRERARLAEGEWDGGAPVGATRDVHGAEAPPPPEGSPTRSPAAKPPPAAPGPRKASTPRIPPQEVPPAEAPAKQAAEATPKRAASRGPRGSR